METKHCNGCGEDKELTEFYIHKSGPCAGNIRTPCKQCYQDRQVVWRKNYPDKTREYSRNFKYRHGTKPASENKKCSTYLGCVIAETVLAHEFPGFVRMPNCNPNYDYECPKGFLIDVKSGCKRYRKGHTDSWSFVVKKNKVPHFFLCIAWKDRKSLLPEHLWLIPGWLVNEKTTFCICDSPKSLAEWSPYERSLGNVLKCCDKMRGGE